MCFFDKPAPSQVTQQTMPAPQQTSDPAAIGKARKKADMQAFGSSTPSLTTNRSTQAVPPAISSGGAGLSLM